MIKHYQNKAINPKRINRKENQCPHCNRVCDKHKEYDIDGSLLDVYYYCDIHGNFNPLFYD